MRSDKSTLVSSFPETARTVPFDNHIEFESTHAHSVALSSVLSGSVITIHTRNTSYRMQVLDGSARRVLITGGLLFPESTEVEVIGASDDSGVRDGFVVEGLQLELSTRRGPVLTSMVVTLSVDADPISPDRPSTSA